ncbi:MAG: MarC family protein [Yoonia sp.]|jgi:multiple antibiotic resistance protein|nr:MarC family protein [Yoonia sp.]MDG1519377.1 MarC family protein [Yoonia sp.]MDG1770237.1 MarC family protein [Yoonia sp.]
MTDLPALIAAFTTLFIIIDPMGLAPIFLALTSGMTKAQRRAIAIRACLIGGALMLAFLFLGEALLGFIGISMPAFRIAGGVLLFLTALEMLFQKRQARREDNATEVETHDDPSVFPLAMPLIVGPGAITTIILLAGQANGAADLAAVAAVMFTVLASVFVAFLLAPYLERLLGKTGINILTRLLGMLLAALAVQFILDGVSQSFGIDA